MQACTIKTGLVFCMHDTIETAFYTVQVEKIISMK